MLFSKTESRKDKTALIDIKGNIKTYGELDKLSSDLECVLTKRSVILIMCDISIETVAMYYCALQLGIIPLLLEAKESGEHICSIIEKYHPKYCLFKKGVENNLTSCQLKVNKEFLEHTLYETSFESYKTYPDLALLLTTSGSTGSEKMVRISYQNIEHNALAIKKIMQITSEDIGITCLPIHHCYGLSLIHMIWASDATLLLFDGSVLNPKFKKTVALYNPSISLFVPYSLELLMNSEYKDSAFDCFRLLSVGGGKQSQSTKSFFVDFCSMHGIIPLFSYGQTEGTTYLATTEGEIPDEINNIGVPIGDMEARIYGENINERGELVFEGNSVTLGYASCYADLLLGDSNKGVLYTGDIAHIDIHGNIYYDGRTKRISKILGERINLDELETILNSEFPGSNFYCADDGESIVICYDGYKRNEKDVVSFIGREVKVHSGMINLLYCDKVPRLSNEKVDYQRIMELINAETKRMDSKTEKQGYCTVWRR